jgi:hypothetical protein
VVQDYKLNAARPGFLKINIPGLKPDQAMLLFWRNYQANLVWPVNITGNNLDKVSLLE